MSAASADASPTLSIIIVSWNCRELLRRCLTDIANSRIAPPYEVIVVDNASTDGTARDLADAFPDVHLIANAENAGFARANNQGVAAARGRFLLLLNPDAFPSTPDTFAALLGYLDAHPDYAALGCRLVHPDGRHQVGDAGFRPTPMNVVLHSFGLSRLARGGAGLFVVRAPALQAPCIDVDWICGACLLVRAEIVRQAGGLDERYFMYAEDVEFGCRLRDKGYRIGYLPNEVVIHVQGGTQAGAGEQLSMKWLDSLARLYRTMNRDRHWLLFRAAMGLGFGLRALAYGAAGSLTGRETFPARARAMAAYARHAWRLRRDPPAVEG